MGIGSDLYGYQPKPLDLDQGVVFYTDSDSGRRVAMYESMPGLYLDGDGVECADETALAAGFDVEGHRREAGMQSKLREAEEQIRIQHAEIEQKIRHGLDPEVVSKLPRISQTPFTDLPRDEADALITRRTSDGKPLGTENFFLNHVGGGVWTVRFEGTEEDLIAPIKDRDAAAKAAIDFEKEFQESRGLDQE